MQHPSVTRSTQIACGNNPLKMIDGAGNIINIPVVPFIPPASDYWRNLSNALPDGVTDHTEVITHDAAAMIGGNIAPASTLEVNGSLSVRAVTSNAASYVMLATDHTVHLILPAAQSVVLPFLASSRNKIVKLVNPTSTAKTTTVNYLDFNGTSINAIPANGSIVLQAEGIANWRLISRSELAQTKKFRTIVNLIAGNNTITHNMGLLDPSISLDSRINSTGAELALRVTSENANNIVVNSAVAVTGARLTIVG